MNVLYWLHAFTIAAFCLGLTPKESRSIADLLGAIVTGQTCVFLHYYVDQPVLPPCLALAFLIWTLLPGSFSHLKLPSHAAFMRNLNIVEREEDCPICWDSDNLLAKLPCSHRICTKCLQVMGEHFQTACPHCRRPLFSIYDRLVFIVSKASVACAAINVLLFSLQGILELGRWEFYNLAISAGSIFGMSWYLRSVRKMIKAFGENWWRGTPQSIDWVQGSITPLAASFAFWTGALLLWQTTGTTNGMLRRYY